MLSEAKAGLTGKVTISSASAISSLNSPNRSRPNKIPVRWPPCPRARSARAASTGARTGLKPSRSRAVVAQHEVEIGDRRGEIGKHHGRVDDVVGLAGRGPRLVVRPAVARIDQPELGQPEIGHGARHHADILAELRLDEDDDRLRGVLLGMFHGRSSCHIVRRIQSAEALRWPTIWRSASGK